LSLFIFFASFAKRRRSLIFFYIDCNNSDNDKLILFVFIETLIFVIFLFMTFKAFNATQIVCVIDLVNSLSRRRRIFKDIKLLIFNEFVNLV